MKCWTCCKRRAIPPTRTRGASWSLRIAAARCALSWPSRPTCPPMSNMAPRTWAWWGWTCCARAAGICYEPLGLDVGRCRLVAGGAGLMARSATCACSRACAWPASTRTWRATISSAQGISAEIIYLDGSVELAPAVGLADLLVDMVQTGRTLRENGLVELQVIMPSAGRAGGEPRQPQAAASSASRRSSRAWPPRSSAARRAVA